MEALSLDANFVLDSFYHMTLILCHMLLMIMLLMIMHLFFKAFCFWLSTMLMMSKTSPMRLLRHLFLLSHCTGETALYDELNEVLNRLCTNTFGICKWNFYSYD